MQINFYVHIDCSFNKTLDRRLQHSVQLCASTVRVYLSWQHIEQWTQSAIDGNRSLQKRNQLTVFQVLP